jgi:hypothetical protein
VIIPKVSKLKDHLFFFANYENFIEHDGSQPVKASVPSTKERTGDFSELLPEGIQLYNPLQPHTTPAATAAVRRLQTTASTSRVW